MRCHSGVLSGHAGRNAPSASLRRKQRSEQWLTARLNLDSGGCEGQGRVEGGQRRGAAEGGRGDVGAEAERARGAEEKERERQRDI